MFISHKKEKGMYCSSEQFAVLLRLHRGSCTPFTLVWNRGVRGQSSLMIFVPGETYGTILGYDPADAYTRY